MGANVGIKVGIVLATYNGGRFLSEQLESFLVQERMPDELLVSDDASTDETLSIVDAFARRAPLPVKVVVNPERLGFIRNFAAALALADADIIFMSDQDDVWLPQRSPPCWPPRRNIRTGCCSSATRNWSKRTSRGRA